MSLNTNTVLQEPTYSNRSYNVSQYAIQGHVKDLEALSQAIHKRLSTQQFDCPLYSFFYGVNWNDLIGESPEYIRPEAKRMIEETLLRDGRIESVDDFDFIFDGVMCTITFSVRSIFGDLKEGVSINV